MANPSSRRDYPIELNPFEPGNEVYTRLKQVKLEKPPVTRVYQESVSREVELYTLVLEDQLESVRAFLLLIEFVDIDHKHDGMTPLHVAAKKGNALMVGLLLNHRADINALTDDEEQTALQIAAIWGRKEVVELLLERGADRQIKNKFKKTASQLAKANGDRDLSRFIKTYGEPPTKASTPLMRRLSKPKSYDKL